jgi:hypothetical protein
MKKSELRKLIKEEISKVLKENELATHRITTDVYYINDYEFDGFKQEAVPEYEISDVEDMLRADEGNHLYIEAGTEGTYEEGMFTTIEGSNTRLESEHTVRIPLNRIP